MSVRPRTFRGRITVAITLLAVGVLAASGGAVVVGVRRTLVAGLDDALREIVDAEIASSADAPGAHLHLHELRDGESGGYERVSELRDEAGEVLVRTGVLARRGPISMPRAALAHALAGQPRIANASCGEESCRAIASPYPLRSAEGRRLVLIVALATAPIDRAHRALLGTFAISLVAGAAATAAGARRLSRRLTRPLDEIAADARAIGESNTGARIGESSSDEEFRSLVAILNGMLERLEAAFAAQRRFVADASHELRSPLANLRGTIEVALRRPRAAEEYRETLGVALAEAERLTRLVDDLLTLSRADAGHFPLVRADVELGALARAAAEAHRARARDCDVEVAIEAPSPLVVLADGDRLREVVDNLIDNALRYAPPGSRVTVRIVGGGDEAVISVADAGPGIAAEDRERVFERFYRADASRARSSGGLGLGLAIVRAIVEAHGGSVSVESEPGHGATFRARLPLGSPGTTAGGLAGAL